MLRDDFVHSGNWLFRWRGQLPILMVALIGIWLASQTTASPELVHWSPAWEGLGIGLALLGFFIRVHTVAHVPAATSGRNTKKQIADRLNVSGMYSVVRHPLYLGNFFMWLGVAATAQSWWFMLICALVFGLYYERIMFAEEHFLRESFGQQYEAWSQTTAAFFPRIWRWRKADLPFSARSVLRRECPTLLGVTAAFAAVDIIKHCLYSHVGIQPFWAISLASVIALSLCIRMVKKHTRLLNVEGR